MGVLERIQQRGSQNHPSPQQKPSSISAPAEPETPELQRIKYVMEYLLAKLEDGTEKGNRLAILMKRVVAEAINDLGDVPSEYLEQYFRETAGMFYWGATGIVLDMDLPPGFVPEPRLTLANISSEVKAAELKPDPELVDAEQRAAIEGSVTETH